MHQHVRHTSITMRPCIHLLLTDHQLHPSRLNCQQQNTRVLAVLFALRFDSRTMTSHDFMKGGVMVVTLKNDPWHACCVSLLGVLHPVDCM